MDSYAGDLKQLQFINTYASYFANQAKNLYSYSRNYVPNSFEGTVQGFETQLQAHVGPLVSNAQDVSYRYLNVADKQVTQVVDKVSEYAKPQAEYLQQQSQSIKANVSKTYQGGYSQLIESKEQGKKKVSNLIEGAFNYAKNVVSSLSAQSQEKVDQVWVSVKDNEHVSHAWSKVEPSVLWAKERYAVLHGHVVSNKHYKSAWDTSEGLVDAVQRQPLYQATVVRVATWVAPIVQPIWPSNLIHALYEHFHPQPSGPVDAVKKET